MNQEEVHLFNIDIFDCSVKFKTEGGKDKSKGKKYFFINMIR